MKKFFWILLTIFALSAGSLVTAESVTQEKSPPRTVDLNRAQVEELVALPGIGEIVARRIVTYREENGPFRKTEELMNVRGIGEKTYLKLKPYLEVSSTKTRK